MTMDDSGMPMVISERTAVDAIINRHRVKGKTSEVLEHVMGKCRRMARLGSLSPGAMRRIEKIVKQARARDDVAGRE